MIQWLRKWLIGTDEKLEQKNVVWNMIGSFLYAFASMVLTMAVVQIVGDEQGGVFTFAFTTFGQQMFMVAYFGMRPYQITDVERSYSFGEYLHLRMLTSLTALVIGVIYIALQGYSSQKAWVVFWMVCYKVIDGFADTYEAEFQRNGYLYLTGKSNAFRTILSVGAFIGTLLLTKELAVAGAVAVIAQVLGVLIFDVCVMGGLPQVDWAFQWSGCLRLMKHCTLLFLSVFLDFYIFSAAKYAIEGNMNDAAMAVYGAIFMPTSVINLVACFIIRPFLTKLSLNWETKAWKDFAAIIRMIFIVIFGLTVLAVGAAAWLGVPVLSLLYPNLREALLDCRLALVMIILGGGFNAWMSLFYYSLIIMKCQKHIFVGYVFVCVTAMIISPIAVVRDGILGGAVSYLILMVLLAVCFGSMTALEFRRAKRS